MTNESLDRARELNRDMPFDGCDPETHTEAANLLGEMAAEIDRLRQCVADLERLLCIERAAEDDRPF